MNKNSVTNNQTGRTLLMVGDLLALAIFIFIGEVQHELLTAYNPLLRVLVQTLALALPWLPLAWGLGAYSVDEIRDRRGLVLFLLRSLAVWIYAAPLGLVVRAWIYGAPTVLVLFANAALAFGGMIILLWRAVFAWWWLQKRTHALFAEPLV
ncbi:MAG: DUF3054 domain-containing protein [Caldilineaceae bacterium]